MVHNVGQVHQHPSGTAVTKVADQKKFLFMGIP
jgi:hypothetical protein